jgi:hypothetical protein
MFFVLLTKQLRFKSCKNKGPRAVDPHCFDADPDPVQNLDADPDPDPDRGGGGEGVGQPEMCIPPCKILGTPLHVGILKPLLRPRRFHTRYLLFKHEIFFFFFFWWPILACMNSDPPPYFNPDPKH